MKKASESQENVMAPGSESERKQHVYITGTWYMLALSLTLSLLADRSGTARPMTLSCHAATPARTSLPSLWPCSLSPRCRGNGAKITWLCCRAGHEFFQRMNACVYVSVTRFQPGVKPHGHMTTNRKWGINPLHNNSMASPKFMQLTLTVPYTELYS